MKRPEHILDRSAFTSTGALAREVIAWLEFSPCKVTVHVHNTRQQEEFYSEMEGIKTVKGRRVDVEVINWSTET